MTITRIAVPRPGLEPLVTERRRVTVPGAELWCDTQERAPRGAMTATAVSVAAQLASAIIGLVTGQWVAVGVAAVTILVVALVTIAGCTVTAMRHSGQ